MTTDDFWEHTREEGACQVWTGGRNREGYGRARVGGETTDYAHRIAYRLAVGPIPFGMLVCHRCDNPPCIYPMHLFLGTAADNIHDAMAKGRFAPAVALARVTIVDITDVRRGIRTVDQVAADLAVSRRTVYRAMAAAA